MHMVVPPVLRLAVVTAVVTLGSHLAAIGVGVSPAAMVEHRAQSYIALEFRSRE